MLLHPAGSLWTDFSRWLRAGLLDDFRCHGPAKRRGKLEQ